MSHKFKLAIFHLIGEMVAFKPEEIVKKLIINCKFISSSIKDITEGVIIDSFYLLCQFSIELIRVKFLAIFKNLSLSQSI